MIESPLLTLMLQSAVSWFWGGIVNTISMPWRGSLAVVFVAYVFRPLIRLALPWLLIGILWLVRGLCWLLVLFEGILSNLLEKAGIKPTSLQAFVSNAASRLDNQSQSLINRMKPSGKKRRPLRLRWAMPAAALIPVIFFSTLSNRQGVDVVPPSLAWWHSFEHFLLSGAVPPGQKHDRYNLTVKDDCQTNNDCLLGEALKTGKATEAELRLDNPDRFPSHGSAWMLERLHKDWIKHIQQSSALKEVFPAPSPTPMSDSTFLPMGNASSVRSKANKVSVPILVPARGDI